MTEINGVNITEQDRYVEKFIKADHSLANDDNRLIAEIWESEDFWKHTDLLTALRSVTSADSIKRSRRRLHLAKFITYDEKVSKRRGKLFEQHRDENSTANIHAIKKNIEKPQQVQHFGKEFRIVGDTVYEVQEQPFVEVPLQTSLPLEEKHV